jgi:hypothetical protein
MLDRVGARSATSATPIRDVALDVFYLIRV